MTTDISGTATWAPTVAIPDTRSLVGRYSGATDSDYAAMKTALENLSNRTQWLKSMGNTTGSRVTSGILWLTSEDQTTGLTVGSPVQVNTVVGDYAVASNRFVIPANTTALLEANCGVHWTSNAGRAVLRFYDVTNAAYVGLSQGMPPVTAVDDFSGTPLAWARVNPIEDTTYELRIESIPDGTIDHIYNTRIKINATTTTAGLSNQTGRMTSGVLWLAAADQSTGLTAGSPVQVDSAVGDFAVASNRFVIPAGTVALLEVFAGLEWTTSAGHTTLRFYNVTAGAYEGAEPLSSDQVACTYASSNYSGVPVAVARVSPVVDTTYEVQISNMLAGTLSHIYNTKIKITAMQPSFYTGVWSKTGMLTKAAAQTTGLTAGSPVQVDTAEGDFTAASNRFVIPAGMTAKLEAFVALLFSTNSWGQVCFYDVTNGAYVGQISNQHTMTGTDHYTGVPNALARVDPLVDTTYELRIYALSAALSRIEATRIFISAVGPAGKVVTRKTLVTSAAGTTTLDDTYYTVVVTGTTTQTIAMPSSPTDGIEYVIKNLSTGNVTVSRAGSQTFDGSATSLTLLQNQVVHLQYISSLTTWIVKN